MSKKEEGKAKENSELSTIHIKSDQPAYSSQMPQYGFNKLAKMTTSTPKFKSKNGMLTSLGIRPFDGDPYMRELTKLNGAELNELSTEIDALAGALISRLPKEITSKITSVSSEDRITSEPLGKSSEENIDSD